MDVNNASCKIIYKNKKSTFVNVLCTLFWRITPLYLMTLTKTLLVWSMTIFPFYIILYYFCKKKFEQIGKRWKEKIYKWNLFIKKNNLWSFYYNTYSQTCFIFSTGTTKNVICCYQSHTEERVWRRAHQGWDIRNCKGWSDNNNPLSDVKSSFVHSTLVRTTCLWQLMEAKIHWWGWPYNVWLC